MHGYRSKNVGYCGYGLENAWVQIRECRLLWVWIRESMGTDQRVGTDQGLDTDYSPTNIPSKLSVWQGAFDIFLQYYNNYYACALMHLICSISPV